MKRRRVTPQFYFLAWASFAVAVFAMYMGIWTLEEPLSVKGYYAVTAAFLIMSAFVLQKVIRDKAEDDDEQLKELPRETARTEKKPEV